MPHCDPASDEAQVRISPESIDNLAHAAFLLGVSQEQLENALKWKERDDLRSLGGHAGPPRRLVMSLGSACKLGACTLCFVRRGLVG